MSRRSRSTGPTVVCLAAGILAAGCSRPTGTTEPIGLPATLDPCLEGNWVMRTGDLDILVTTLVPLPNMHVYSGSLFLSFTSSGGYRYGSDGYVETIELGPGRRLEGTFVFLTTGTYGSMRDLVPADMISGGVVTLNADGTQKQVVEWVGYKDDQVEEVPGGMPESVISVTGPVRYECADQELVLYNAGPTGDVPMFFKRP